MHIKLDQNEKNISLRRVFSTSNPEQNAVRIVFTVGTNIRDRATYIAAIYRTIELATEPARPQHIICDRPIEGQKLSKLLTRQGSTKSERFNSQRNTVEIQAAYPEATPEVYAHYSTETYVPEVHLTFPAQANGDDARHYRVLIQKYIAGIISAQAKDTDESRPLLQPGQRRSISPNGLQRALLSLQRVAESLTYPKAHVQIEAT